MVSSNFNQHEFVEFTSPYLEIMFGLAHLRIWRNPLRFHWLLRKFWWPKEEKTSFPLSFFWSSSSFFSRSNTLIEWINTFFSEHWTCWRQLLKRSKTRRTKRVSLWEQLYRIKRIFGVRISSWSIGFFSCIVKIKISPTKVSTHHPPCPGRAPCLEPHDSSLYARERECVTTIGQLAIEWRPRGGAEEKILRRHG